MEQEKPLVDLVRRDLVKRLLGISGVAMLTPELLLHAAQAGAGQSALFGPRVADVKPEKITDKVYYIPARQGKFPSPKNKGFFTNIMFVVSNKGVIVIDPSASIEIGRMAIRMIKTVTKKPIIAVINTHYHGDHWMGNHAFEEAYPGIKIYAKEEVATAIKGVLGETWIDMALHSTKNATKGTKIVPPNAYINDGDELKFGDVSLKIHHYGQCHTPFDMLVEVEGHNIVHMGDVCMDHRLAGMGNGEGSFIEGIKTLEKIKSVLPGRTYFPAHGVYGKHLIDEQLKLFKIIYNTASEVQQEGGTMGQAAKKIKADPFMVKYAKETEDFEHGLGQWTSIAYLEAESANF